MTPARLVKAAAIARPSRRAKPTTIVAAGRRMDVAQARWAYAKGRAAGSGTDTLPTVPWKFHPLPTAQGVAGLVGLRFADRSRAGR
jgi:K+-sensing histidine kinase KdpD